MFKRRPPVDPKDLYNPSSFYAQSRSVRKSIGDDFDEMMWNRRWNTPQTSSDELHQNAGEYEAFFKDLGEG